MASETTPNTAIVPPAEAQAGYEKLQKAVADLRAEIEKTNAIQTSGSAEEKQQSEGKIAGLKKEMAVLNSRSKEVADGKVAFKSVSEEAKHQGGVIAGLMNKWSSYKSVMESASNAIKAKLNDVIGLFGAAAPAAIAKSKREFLEYADSASGGLFTMQTEALGFQKNILQAGQSFGQTFTGAHGNIKSFMDRWSATVNTVKATPEEVAKVTEAFKNVMPIQEQVRSLSALKTSHSELHSTITATNAALLIAAAKGMDAGTAAQWMGKAVTELGATTEQATSNFAKIAWAADKSGLGFEKVGQSIMDAAGQLKMWGGTVSSVAPVYKAFSDSLAGTGRQGLTPQLLQSFIQGLQGMQFGTRALLGMQMPGGAAKGALGAGLEMEAALEQGPEGMKKISDSLVATLKQFGGGKVLTRQEAIADPNQQRNFMVQRQLLVTQMGLDQATANKTLDMLKNIDKNGLSSGGDMQEQLDSLLTSGEKTNAATQATMQKAMNEQYTATINGTKEIVSAITKAMGGKLGAMIKAIDDAGPKLVTGAPSTAKTVEVVKETAGKIKDVMSPKKAEPGASDAHSEKSATKTSEAQEKAAIKASEAQEKAATKAANRLRTGINNRFGKLQKKSERTESAATPVIPTVEIPVPPQPPAMKAPELSDTGKERQLVNEQKQAKTADEKHRALINKSNEETARQQMKPVEAKKMPINEGISTAAATKKEFLEQQKNVLTGATTQTAKEAQQNDIDVFLHFDENGLNKYVQKRGTAAAQKTFKDNAVSGQQ